MEQVHCCRACGQFLFPDGYLVVSDGRRDQNDQRFALPCKLIRLFMMRGSCTRIFFLQRLAEEARELLPLLLADDDEAPGCKLAVIRHTHGDFKDLPKLLIGRAGSDHFTRAAGAAGL